MRLYDRGQVPISYMHSPLGPYASSLFWAPYSKNSTSVYGYVNKLKFEIKIKLNVHPLLKYQT